MKYAVECKALTRSWPSGFTLGPITWTIAPGETIAIFGKNGAGKSTLFQMLSGSMDRSDGDIYVLGEKMNPDAHQIKKKFGYLPQESTLPDWATPDELLSFAARIHGLPHPDEQVEQELTRWDALAWRHRPLVKLSHGMRRRIGLSIALLHDPEVVILDEPFNALDIMNSRILENVIADRQKRGKTTLVSIHSPLLAAHICPQAVILAQGQLEVLTQWPHLKLLDRAKFIETRFFGDTPS